MLSKTNKLIFGLGFVIMTPSPVVRLCGNSFASLGVNVHQIFKGKSPLLTEQVVVTDSSRLNSSSPKENGVITGRT